MSTASRIALVTGASRGLGRATSLALSKAGYTIALAARTSEDLNAVAEEISVSGGKAAPFVCDVTSNEQCQKLVRRVTETFGRLDVLVNNAGLGIYGPVEEVTEEDLDTLLAVNLKGTIFCSQASYVVMKQQGAGHIINVGSIAGKIGLPGESIYCASKFAVSGFTEALAEEAKAHNVKVTNFCPGGIDTPFWDRVTHNRPDLSKFMRPDDVARMIVAIAETPDGMGVPEVILRPLRDRH